MHTRRFRSSAYYGDAGGAGARSESSDWTILHGNELWIDDSGYVFLVFATTGPTDPRLQVLYRPDGTQPSKVYFANDPLLPRIVDALRTKGRKASPADIERYRGMATARMSGGGGSAAPAATFTAFAPAAPPVMPAPLATTQKPAKQKGRRKKKTPLYKRTWFPFAVGGAVLLTLGIVAVAVKSRRAQGAA